jgi:hypothetical protein
MSEDLLSIVSFARPSNSIFPYAVRVELSTEQSLALRRPFRLLASWLETILKVTHDPHGLWIVAECFFRYFA